MTYRELTELPARFRKRITLVATAAALALTPATAQQITPAQPTAYQRAIAAGYKALTLCSAMFNAGRDQAAVEAVELKGVYPEYDRIVPTLPATVDDARLSVSVAYALGMPPRVAQWQAHDGCTIVPPGTIPEARVRFSLERPTPPPPTDLPWPLGDRSIAPPANALLQESVARAFDGASYGAGATIGVVVLREDRVVAERYAAGFGPFTSNRTWSVAKSITGTLAGMAVLREEVKIDAPANILNWHSPGNRFPDPRAAITLDHPLRMSSGLHSDTAGNRTDAIYFGGATVDEETVAWPLEALPGARFRYANNDILLVARSLLVSNGDERRIEDFAEARLFEPLGMIHTVAERDWHGNYILSSQVWSTARDLARLGQFWLQGGVWQGKRLLPEGWMRYMTTPSGPQPAEGPGYGATMWLFGPKQGLPEGSYAAQGNRGQYIMVIPSKRLVIVRRGEDPGAARFDIARFAADISKALP